MSKAYYNEHDRFAAAWLRELIKAGHIADGDVDERDIQEVKPHELDGYTQVHLFAGIGGWSYALRLAGWPDDRPVWTGSCPCQPFSAAGKRKGEADDRHLWPEMRRLIAERKPATCFGEQVASDDGCRWLAGVFADLEAMEYRVAGADLCAAGVGSPHIRQRIWWVADSGRGGIRCGGHAMDGAARGSAGEEDQRKRVWDDARHGGNACRMVNTRDNANAERTRAARRQAGERTPERQQPRGAGDACGLGLAGSDGPQGQHAGRATPWAVERTCSVDCRDGKQRRLEPGLSPLAHGVPARVGRLRGYGNAIVPAVAATFIQAYCEALT